MDEKSFSIQKTCGSTWNSFMDPFPDEGVVMDPGVSPQDFSGRPSQQDFRGNNGAISKPKDKDKDRTFPPIGMII